MLAKYQKPVTVYLIYLIFFSFLSLCFIEVGASRGESASDVLCLCTEDICQPASRFLAIIAISGERCHVDGLTASSHFHFATVSLKKEFYLTFHNMEIVEFETFTDLKKLWAKYKVH